jgi:hypothetical protein
MFISVAAIAQEPNYDKSAVPKYTLPDLLRLKNGKEVNSRFEWEKKRRPEIISDFKKEVYGKVPGKLCLSSVEPVEQDSNALDGRAIRKQVNLIVSKNGKTIKVGLLMYLPKIKEPSPLFVGYNFYGNQTVSRDPGILLPTSWVMNEPSYGITNHQATEESRGAHQSYWCVEKLINSGYGLATVYYGDIDPDKNDFTDGVHPFFYKAGQVQPAPDEWGSIAAWAWGLSRILDYLVTDKSVDKKNVIVIGHSRLGKAALWAGALDKRFAMVISNESGCGGAALSRRIFGETVERINNSFPYWFCTNFKKYNRKENLLPVDQHMLIALIAPRPVYIASAAEDLWADPVGEYLSGFHASEIYNLYGFEGLSSPEMPAVNKPVMNRIGYHIRSGSHKVTEYDWDQYIRFANQNLKAK